MASDLVGSRPAASRAEIVFMVRRGPFSSFLTALTLSLLFTPTLPLPLAAKDQVYRIGDPIEADIVSPERLTVPDVEATDAAKDREAQKVLVIYRFYPG